MILLFVGTTQTVTAATKDFFYYNPDSLQSNLAHLKSELDQLFARAGYPINFQPFAHHIDFNKKTYEKKPAFLLVPVWYLKKHGSRLNLHPILKPVHNNSDHYQKTLMVTKSSGITNLDIQHRSLAMTTMGPNGEAILNQVLFSRYGIDANRMSIVTVPKDSDALFALTLGQVDMALVTKQNIDQLKKINPNIVKSLKAIDTSSPIPLPLLCYMRGRVTQQELQNFKRIFLNLGKQKSDLKAMEMLQIDEWKTIP